MLCGDRVGVSVWKRGRKEGGRKEGDARVLSFVRRLGEMDVRKKQGRRKML